MTQTTPAEIKLWESTWHLARNTGILCARSPAIDIDITAPEAATAIEDMVRECFSQHGNVMVRIGKAPKRAVLFRTDEPFPKIVGNVTGPDGSEQKIELLCAGQQVIVDGTHPTTGKPYSWHGGTPTEIPRKDLPPICAADARALVEGAVNLLIDEFNYTRVRTGGKDVPPGDHADWQTLINNIHVGRQLHDSLLSLAAKLITSGMTSGAAINFLRALMEGSHAPHDARWQERYDDIPRLVNSANPNHARNLMSVRASTIPPQAIDWLWPDRFALGKIGLIAGLPDEGKGQLLCDMAARITKIGEWPCGEGKARQGNVILLTAEDDPSDTVVPRLKAAGADLNRVEIVKMVQESKGKERMFSLVTDLALLRQKIVAVGGVVQVQIDPVSAYLGVKKIDSFRTSDVRAVLGPLVELAIEMHVSVVGILHFNKRTDVTNALLRISDSLAFGATARHVYAAVSDPQNQRKLLVRGKNNVATKDQRALAYGFGVREVGFDARLNKVIEAPHIEWLGHVDVTATQAMQTANDASGPSAASALEDAKKLLSDLLARGPVPMKDIEEAAHAEMISKRTLSRAKRDLGVISHKTSLDGPWVWELTDKYDDQPVDAKM